MKEGAKGVAEAGMKGLGGGMTRALKQEEEGATKGSLRVV